MQNSTKRKMFRLALLLVFVVIIGFFYNKSFFPINTRSKPSNVSTQNVFQEEKSEIDDSLTPSRKTSLIGVDSVLKQEMHEKNEQKVQNLKKYTNFNTANTKPFFKVGPGSVKKLSAEKPKQSNPFQTGVEPSSSDRLPTITVDDESVPAIFSSSPNANDCESQSLFDTLPAIDLLNGELKLSIPDSSLMQKP